MAVLYTEPGYLRKPPAQQIVRKPPVSTAKPGGVPENITDRVLRALIEGPMTSLELEYALNLERHQVAPACWYLKSKGLIDRKSDGTRRYFLKGTK